MQWDPEVYLRQRHADVQVWESDLPDGLLGCVDHKRRIIWLSRDLCPRQRRSTLAVEIGHLEQGPTPTDHPGLASAMHRAAEEWAALMLIPTDVFAEAWGVAADLPAMASWCGVDVATFRTRIRAASDADQDLAMEAIYRLEASA